MTEWELYQFLGPPAVVTLTALLFVKALWRKRIVVALAVATLSLAISLLGIWATRAGAPPILGWMVVPAGMLIATVILRLWVSLGGRPSRGVGRTKEAWMRHPVAVVRLAHAVVLRNAGKDIQAKGSVEKAYRAYGAEAPSARAPVMLNAFYADLCERTGAVEVAYEAARTAIIQINEINAGERRGSPRIAENQWFILYWMRFVLSRLSQNIDSEAWELALAIPADYSQLDLPRTSSILKNDMFPFDREWAIQTDLMIERARQGVPA